MQTSTWISTSSFMLFTQADYVESLCQVYSSRGEGSRNDKFFTTKGMIEDSLLDANADEHIANDVKLKARGMFW